MLKNLKFHNKLFVSFSIFMVLILTVSGIIFYYYTVSIIEKNAADNQRQTTQKLQEQLDGLLSEMDRITIAVNSSEYIMELLKNIDVDRDGNYFDTNPRVNDLVKSALYSYVSPRFINGRISLITKNYDYTDFNNQMGNQVITKEYIKKVKWIENIMFSNQFKVFIPPHQDDWSTNKSSVFSVVRPLRDNYNVYGIVEISRSIQEIDKICDFKDSNSKIHVAIFDNDKKLIYDNFDSESINDKKILYSNTIEASETGSFIINKFPGKTKLIASFSKLSSVNWTVVQFEDMETFNKPISLLSKIILVTYILIFIILLLVLYIFTGIITKPIRTLKKSISMVDVENLKLVLEHNSTNNEITLLSEAFQDLLGEVKKNTEKAIQSHNREMKAHMLALQAQLNPHFLYNTLTVIGAYGQKKNNIEVAQMCSYLANMLRYTVELSSKNTTVNSEVQHIKSYLKLMSIRFEGFLNYEINIDEAMLIVNVPKLILEPIIENSFRYGFADIEPPWKIFIDGYIKDGNWYIKVRDNGQGFDENAFNRLKIILEEAKKVPSTEVYSNDVEKGGLGLINTFLRLHIYFDGNEYIDYYNAPEGGAVIVVGGPL